jgi:hypothetical protein
MEDAAADADEANCPSPPSTGPSQTPVPRAASPTP